MAPPANRPRLSCLGGGGIWSIDRTKKWLCSSPRTCARALYAIITGYKHHYVGLVGSLRHGIGILVLPDARGPKKSGAAVSIHRVSCG